MMENGRLHAKTYLQSPALSSATSPLQTVSTSPVGVSFCTGIGHRFLARARAIASLSFSVWIPSNGLM